MRFAVLLMMTASWLTAAERSPVLVELFTSEGCSSCPPADQLLRKLEETQPVPGVQILALSEHVDYWNSLGWKDPFSNSQFSERQAQYARAFHLDSNYTPQMVVDGRAEFVGSDAPRAGAALRRAAQEKKASVALAWQDGRLTVRVEDAPAGRLQVMVAIAEGGLQSRVAHGENGGRTLLHTAVVRRLQVAGVVKNGRFVGEVPVTLAREWKRENLKAVAFVQNVESRAVVGGGTVALK